MKKSCCLILCLILFSSILYCQSVKRELTNAEVFSEKSGTLIETQFISVGFVDQVELRVMKIKDINSGSVMSALRFEYQTTNQIFSQTKLAIVDQDELDGLISAVKTLITKIFIYGKDTYTEVIFKSRSGFITGGYYTADKKKWIAYIQLDKQDTKSTILISKEDFEHFLELLKLAKEKI